MLLFPRCKRAKESSSTAREDGAAQARSSVARFDGLASLLTRFSNTYQTCIAREERGTGPKVPGRRRLSKRSFHRQAKTQPVPTGGLALKARRTRSELCALTGPGLSSITIT